MNLQTIRPAPVLKSRRVSVAPDRAFAIFTAMNWWPGSHSIRRESPFRTAVLEPRVGGRWYEESEDGGTCDWGRVLEWDPPRGLVLAWQIDADWQFDPAFETRVDITFEADGTGTLIRVEHKDIERFGDRAAAVRAAFEGDGGWSGLLELFAATI